MTDDREFPIRVANEIIFDCRKEIVEVIEIYRPDLLIIDSYLPSVAIAAYTGLKSTRLSEINLPIIFLHVSLITELMDEMLSDISRKAAAIYGKLPSFDNLPRLVLCPREFELAAPPHERRNYY